MEMVWKHFHTVKKSLIPSSKILRHHQPISTPLEVWKGTYICIR